MIGPLKIVDGKSRQMAMSVPLNDLINITYAFCSCDRAVAYLQRLVNRTYLVIL
jgi:hypothetical protein